MARRPEYAAPPEIFYNEQEAAKYTSNSRIMEIQSAMSERAIELLALPEDECHFILDLGCGSGLSGDVLEEQGHVWVGVDISQAMLNVALEREASGDMLLGDLGHGVCFRAGAFDGAISISALQWLCNADKKSHNPVQRLHKFFSSLYACLLSGESAPVFSVSTRREQADQDRVGPPQQGDEKRGFHGVGLGGWTTPTAARPRRCFLCCLRGVPRSYPRPSAQLPKPRAARSSARRLLDGTSWASCGARAPNTGPPGSRKKKSVGGARARRPSQTPSTLAGGGVESFR
ncbi:methyltransferase, putative [Ixodes scapularis]|uniref:Methyltransferase, putative n=1 Tax=Ixodes scapularis TaxID=6945 RepID=B7PA94_IXOSC|nr:methyltransferase, putative [Ixodes scapularis]|eukprot:XP_002406663.1 methyltransferase, putative [Ixodes scapularis]